MCQINVHAIIFKLQSYTDMKHNQRERLAHAYKRKSIYTSVTCCISVPNGLLMKMILKFSEIRKTTRMVIFCISDKCADQLQRVKKINHLISRIGWFTLNTNIRGFGALFKFQLLLRLFTVVRI